MIRINLLPVRVSKKSAAGRQWILLFVVVAGAALVANYLWVRQIDGRISEVKVRIAADTEKNKKLEETIGKVKDLKKAKDEIKQKLGVLNKLKEGRMGPVRVMDELSTIIPQRVWITSWQEQAGAVTIMGAGTSNDEVAAFMRALRTSKFFDEVELKTDKMVRDNEYDFQITCKVKYAA